MVQQLPAVVIGGPPHAGKSVLLYNLTHALYERGIHHHALRACPDGEGNWFQEGHPQTVSLIRDNNKRQWSGDFISAISSNLEHRCLPLLVDMGGHPQMTELPLFQHCTHAVLLLRADKPDSTQLWLHMITEATLSPLAQLISQQQGNSFITANTPFLEGTITGLERQSQVVRQNPVFIALVQEIERLFALPDDLERGFLQHAPTKTVLNLPDEVRAFTTDSIFWQPEMLVPFLRSVPGQTPLSVHGWGPNWLYAALAAHAGQETFYQFDPKLPFGWIQPVPVHIGEMSERQSLELRIEKTERSNATILSITFPTGRIDYFQPDTLAFPSIPLDRGLILDGPLPYWLLTAIVRLYQQEEIAWIAPHHAQQNVQEQRKTAIVIYSRLDTPTLGKLIDIPV